jgi:hypothetical protein
MQNLRTLCSRCHGFRHRGAKAPKNDSLHPGSRFSRKKLVELSGPFSRAW